MLLQILTDSTQSEKIVLWTLIFSSLGSLITSLIALAKGQFDRIQERKDNESKSDIEAQKVKILIDELKAQDLRYQIEAIAREERIRKDIQANTASTEEALRVANGHNAKIAASVKLSHRVLSKLVPPAAPVPPVATHVIVDNMLEHPVPTKNVGTAEE